MQDSLAFTLCQMYGADQMLRTSKGFNNKWDLLIWPTDSTLFENLSQIVRKHGYPREELLGEKYMTQECVSSAAYAILLHSPHRLINEKEYLNLYLDEVKDDRLELSVLLEVLDKPNFFKRDEEGDRKLVYGSNWGKPCLKNRKLSDSLRKEIGLAPLNLEDFIDCSKEK
ncbi:hypothetical protein DDD_2220 [Nonlabens dokdonensis DSW-6]|uniref:Uncharacterized protein n=1 Tax=Nonlabens dokdonensis (strain DSM 17205 / KCTC 12402 / DSW-6) TaxID=592029 RepID=L7WAY8_NONDD|nr:hypothetical protein DDD_2220 [Nonlabens dokdonensis DSW-6]